MATIVRKETALRAPLHHNKVECTGYLLPLRDALDIVGGKWKSVIVLGLSYRGKSRFMELHRDIHGITAKMLSKELKELEANGIVTRTVLNTMPVTVTYELTPYGKTLENVLHTMREWGAKHRERAKRNGPVKAKRLARKLVVV